MSSLKTTTFTTQGSSRVVKSETRTIKRDGITETITTEVLETYSNGLPTKVYRTITTKEGLKPIGRSSSSSSNSSPETSPKNKSNSFLAKVTPKNDQKSAKNVSEPKQSSLSITALTIKPVKSNSSVRGKATSSSDSDSYEEHLKKSVLTTKFVKTYSPATTTKNVVTVTTTGHNKVETKHSNSSNDSSPETTQKSRFQSLLGKFNVKQDKNEHKAHKGGGEPKPTASKTPIISKPVKISDQKSSKKTDSSSSSDSDSDDFAEECLKHHNYNRAKHGVPNLKLSKSICRYAQEWADKCAKEESMRHRTDHKYGENIFMVWASNSNHKINGKEPVDSWYSEISQHKFGIEPRSLGSGHFTQVVWKGSKEFGVGIARSKNGKIFVVANYDPPGNMIGSFAANVPSPKY